MTDRPGDPRAGGESDGATPGSIVIVGAGPAGLTAAYQLTKRGTPCTVFEADGVVGGISRTVERDGWRFDIGGHRFFTKVREVDDLWHEILGPDDFLIRPRLSRIYYDGKFFDYPIQVGNALEGARPRRVDPLRPVLPVGADPPAEEPRLVRGLDGAALRLAPVPDVLQDLHREGLGHARRRDQGRLGGPADQDAVAAEGRAQRARRPGASRPRSPRSSRSSSTRGSAPA